ncbi:MAG: hypothetical protein JXA67_12060 [Micromonosporaceae bacterium]|nr:hypothetical protein [Micromonosporaceae bacterium]
MRHVGSFVLSLFLAPVIYGLLMRGSHLGGASMTGKAAGSAAGWQTDLLLGCALLVAAGVLYAMLLLVRISPLGPCFAGIALTSAGVLTLIDLTWVASHRELGPVTLHPSEPAGIAPVLVALGVPLILTIFSPSRWRRAKAAAPSPSEAGSGLPASSLFPASPSPTSPASPYESGSAGSSFGSPSPGLAAPSYSSQASYASQAPGYSSSSGYSSPSGYSPTAGFGASDLDEAPTTTALPTPAASPFPPEPPSSAPPLTSPPPPLPQSFSQPGPTGSFNGFQPANSAYRSNEQYWPAHGDPDTTQPT